MRVGVDGTELAPGAPGGVRRALFLLLDALQHHAPEVELSVLAPGKVDAPPGVRVQPTGGPRKPRAWRRSRALKRAVAGLDLFHSPVTAFPTLDCPVTATVHEVPFVAYRKLDGFWRANAQLYWVSRAVAECGGVIVPSEATRAQVLTLHPGVGPKLAVVPHPAPPTPVEEQRAHDGSLLFVGRLDRRKRIDALLAGAAIAGVSVRLVGPHAETARERIEEVARSLGIERRVLFMGEVDEEMLDYLYRQACAVGLVSSSEGFGFPVLEALARSIPVIVSRGTGAAETGGGAVLVVDPDRPEQIAAALARAADPEYRAEVRRLGPAQALRFRPERTARGYLEVFRRALAR